MSTSTDPQTPSSNEDVAAEAVSNSTRGASPGKNWTLWILRRVGLAVITLWLVSVVVFLATSALGDPVRAILGKDFAVSPERVATIRAELHLDDPLLVRYGRWLGGLLSGDPGNSIANGLPVTELLGSQVLNSGFLVLVTAVIMIPLSLFLALLSARFRGSWVDNVIQVVTLSLAGIPEFVTGIVLVTVFSTSVMQLLPAVTIVPPGAAPWGRPLSLILPVATLVIAVTPYLTRILRSNLVEVMDSDYVELARLKGIPENTVLVRHALPNTLVPTIQVTALQLAWLVGGVVLVEYLFAYPGIGAALVDSVRNSDFPMVQAIAMLVAAFYVVVNLLADVLSILSTPRARTAMSS
ncbi:MAG: ABC transporter permease [Propionibacteriaceae bacterium]|nr:ABC transporter permease [Propionibacteriaceae bacterium]